MTERVIKFSAPWCNPCKVLNKALEGFTGVPIDEVNIDDCGDLAVKYQIRSVPTLVFERDGEEVSRKTGAIRREAFTSWVNGLKSA